MSGEKFNADYFERGPETKVSCYTRYRWLPYKTIPAVMAYIDHLGIERGASVLDFGCAKGFYVRAFRLLRRDAWGCDLSAYALSGSDRKTRPYLGLCTEGAVIPFEWSFDYIIAKDVFEHMSESGITQMLEQAKRCSPKKVFVVVPLAENGKYVIPEDELDTTHIVRKTKDEWLSFLGGCGWQLDSFSYRICGLKDHQAKYAHGVGFFTLTLGE